jgi:hypothetical protein
VAQIFSALYGELQRRLVNLDSTRAKAAINRAQRYIASADSLNFFATGGTLVVTGGLDIVALPATMDPGRAYVFFDANRKAIKSGGIQDFMRADGYNVEADKGYDMHFIAARNVRVRPIQSTDQTLSVLFHIIPTDYSADSDTGLMPVVFEELMIDFAEAAERRIYDIGDWATLWKLSLDRLNQLADGYRTVTQFGMPGKEAAAAIAERTKLGRP